MARYEQPPNFLKELALFDWYRAKAEAGTVYWQLFGRMGRGMAAFSNLYLTGTLRAAAAGVMIIAAVAGSSSPGIAQGAVKSTHGAWKIVCDTPPGTTAEQCGLMQEVTIQARPEVSLTVIILRTADRKSELLRVLAPLGVLLPNGVRLTIDGKEIVRTHFLRCFQDGCYAEVPFNKRLSNAFKAGKTATFFIFRSPDEKMAIPCSLTGFTGGYKAIP